MARRPPHEEEKATYGEANDLLLEKSNLGLPDQSPDCPRNRYDFQLSVEVELGLKEEVRNFNLTH